MLYLSSVWTAKITNISQLRYQWKFNTKRSFSITLKAFLAPEDTVNVHKFPKKFAVQHLLVNPFGNNSCLQHAHWKNRSYEMSGEYKTTYFHTHLFLKLGIVANKSHTEILDYSRQCSSTARTTTVTSQNRALQWYSFQSKTTDRDNSFFYAVTAYFPKQQCKGLRGDRKKEPWMWVMLIGWDTASRTAEAQKEGFRAIMDNQPNTMTF